MQYAEDESLDWTGENYPDVPVEHRWLVRLIASFYQLDGCGTGGPPHPLVDDTNVDGDYAKWRTSLALNTYGYSDEATKTSYLILDGLEPLSIPMRALVTNEGASLGYDVQYGRVTLDDVLSD